MCYRGYNNSASCNTILSLFKAGIASANNPEQLLIALEPEAASIHCRDKKMKDFTSERGDAGVSDVFARPAAKYLVVDIGGNVVDAIALS